MKTRNKANIIFLLCLIFCSGMNMEILQGDKDIEENVSSITPRKLGSIRFEDEISGPEETDYGVPSNGFRFQEDVNDSGHEAHNSGRISFQDDNKIDYERPHNQGYERPHNQDIVDFGKPGYNDNEVKVDNSVKKKKKRRRRRRPRYQQIPNGAGPFPPGLQYPGPPTAGLPSVGLPPIGPSYPGIPGYVPPYPGIPGPVPPYPGYGPGHPGQYYRPPRRPKPSFASEALTAVTGALSSIAQYDDYQCVPRLLCEAAGGGALGSSGVLQSVTGLQPLLALLAAYNGISSSPLFVFGRAVFLGMTAKGNTASCRYAYPQCPTDPEQLVYYLNNHNGGFFRFFNTPQQNTQNLDQFYQQLSLQGQYGPQTFTNPYPQNQQTPQQFHQQPQNYSPDLLNQQNYGHNSPQIPNPFYFQQNPPNFGPDSQLNQPSYGFQQAQNLNQNQYGLYRPQLNQFPQQNYGLQHQQFQNTQSLYSSNGYGYLQSYGKKYPYNKNNGLNNIKDKGDINKIKRRIQNNPNHESNIENSDSDKNFKFPDNFRADDDDESNTRGGKVLKFPDENKDDDDDAINKRKLKNIPFSEAYNTQNVNNEYSNTKITNAFLKYLNYSIRDAALENYIKYYNFYHGNPDVNQQTQQNYNVDQQAQQNYNKNQNNLQNYGTSQLSPQTYVSPLNYNANQHNLQSYIVNQQNPQTYVSPINFDQEEGVQTVYIVRGNGDPNNPEIVKVRPGEQVKL